ncbi:MAG TPA: branched-chain amino acid ABC transporter permease [Ktedonobacterales bacterium]|jgi:branched-chain amino acid transport system permease protein
MQAFLQVTISGLVTGSLYGLLALGLVLIYRTTGVLNFAYSAISVFAAGFLYILLTGPRMNFWVALPLSLLFAAALGAVVERLFARPVLHAPVFTKAIATLALALVLATIEQAIWPQLAQTEHFPTPFEGAAINVGGVYVTVAALLALLVTAVVVAALTLFLGRTRLGIAMRASADNQAVAQLMGAPVSRIFLLTWSVASVVGALTAIMLAAQQRTINITYMDPVLILAFVAAVLGGLDSLPGALIGGVLVGLADNWLALGLAGHQLGPLDISAPGIRATIIFVAFILVLLLRPQGLLGKAELRRV